MQTLLAETPEQVQKDDIVFMECPFCRHDIAGAWQPFVANSDHLGRRLPQFQSQIHTTVGRGETRVSVTAAAFWLQCQNTQCQEIVIQIVRTEAGRGTESWIALPKRSAAPVLNQLVTDPFRKDYLEAWAILEDSPQMSAVLSRRILADLLKKYDGATQFNLTARIDSFVANSHHPSRLRDNLHYLRAIADFGAHTQTQAAAPASTPSVPPPQIDETIISATPEEAQWTLKIVADLFDYFIIAPQKDEALRMAMDEKIKAAGRKPVR